MREVKIDVRTPEGSPVTWQDATLPIGTALHIVPRFRVTAEDDHTGLGNDLDVEYDQAEGRFVVRKAATWSLAGGEVTGNELRQVRIAEILQHATPYCVAFSLYDENDPTAQMVTAADVSATGRLLPEWLSRTLSASLSTRRSTELREARLDAVQLVYGVAALTGQPPSRAIERELDVPARTATHWIKQAREAGRLDGLGYAAGRPHGS